MLKALVIKELRESVGVAALAAAAILYALADMAGIQFLPWQMQGSYAMPFVNDSLRSYLAMIVGGLAIGLGLKQTAWEFGQNTHYFLFHRPISRGRMIAMKLVVGLAWVLVLSTLLILLWAWWAATPGRVPAPFYWSMTIPAWQLWFTFPIVYLGAFLSGIRPGHWFGSRLVPLVAAIFIATAAASLPLAWLAAVISSISIIAFTIAIFYYINRRDY
jgi:hypothetical protein